MDDPRWIEYLPIDELPDNPRNAKGHDVGLIGASAGRFGFIEPVVLDDRTGQPVSGHGRKEMLLAARQAGQEPPEGIVVRDGAWFSPVVRGWEDHEVWQHAHDLARDDLTERIATMWVDLGTLGVAR